MGANRLFSMNLDRAQSELFSVIPIQCHKNLRTISGGHQLLELRNKGTEAVTFDERPLSTGL